MVSDDEFVGLKVPLWLIYECAAAPIVELWHYVPDLAWICESALRTLALKLLHCCLLRPKQLNTRTQGWSGIWSSQYTSLKSSQGVQSNKLECKVKEQDEAKEQQSWGHIAGMRHEGQWFGTDGGREFCFIHREKTEGHTRKTGSDQTLNPGLTKWKPQSITRRWWVLFCF